MKREWLLVGSHRVSFVGLVALLRLYERDQVSCQRAP